MKKRQKVKRNVIAIVFANILLISFLAVSCAMTPGAANDAEEKNTTVKQETAVSTFIPVTEVSNNAASSNPSQWELVFSDEFNYSGYPDPAKWAYDIGIGLREDGWGSWEEQYYTDNLRNASVGDGYLTITALKEEYGSIIPETGADHRRHYTSARLVTRGKAEFTYGRYEFRAKLPSGRGTWPAIWMLGASYNAYNWPDCGEIDIVEHVGTDPDGVLGGIHCADYNFQDYTAKNHTQSGVTAETAFHDYALEWDSEKIEIFIDGSKHFTFYNEHKGESSWPFDNPFYLILNIAIGGGWGGQQGIDDSIFPQSMLVDYVRVYRKLPAGTITASGEYANAGETKEMAFDGNTATKWLTFEDSCWIQYDFAGDTAKVINSYSITSANDAVRYSERNPETWDLLGSNDGSSWTTLDSRTGETFSANFEKKTYSFTNTTAYKMYRLDIISNLNPSQANSTQISELELIEGSGSGPLPAGPVVLKAVSNGKYVSSEYGQSSLVCNRDQPGSWEQFQFIANGDGSVSLLSLANNKYVCAAGGGTDPLIADRSRKGSWEKFNFIRNADGTVSLQARANGKYVCALQYWGNELVADVSTIGQWERFIVEDSNYAGLIWMSKPKYGVNKTITVNFDNLPGGYYDWVGIYYAGDSDLNYLAYKYVYSAQDGTFTFSGLPAGNYEARLFYNDSYTEQHTVPFIVK